MKNAFDEHVAIFWDYENCTPPCNVPGYDVVNNIRQVAHQYGSVKLFKAYLELSEQSSSKSIGLRSELQSCGVSLTDCPHNGRKDVADKMMIVDMLTYAIDNPAPATIVLISGDRDFVYAVSVLRLRRYRVVVVAPFTAHGSLKSQASVVLDWEADIMRRTTVRPPAPEPYYQAPADDALHRSPRRPPQTLGGTLPPVTQRSVRRPSFRAAASAPAAGPDGGSFAPGASSFQGRHQRTTSAVTVDGSLRYDHPLPTDRSYYRGTARQHAYGSLIGDVDDEDEDPVVDRRPIPDIVDVMEDLQESMSRGTRAQSEFEIPAAISTIPFQTSPQVEPTSDGDDIVPAAPLPNQLTEETNTMNAPHGIIEHDLPSGSIPLGISSPVLGSPNAEYPRRHLVRLASVGRLSSVLNDPSFVPSSPLQRPRGSSVSFRDAGPSSSIMTGPGSPQTTGPTALPIAEPAGVAPGAPSTVSSIPPASGPDLSRSMSVTSAELPALGGIATAVETPPPVMEQAPSGSFVPEKFRHLVNILQEMRSGGNEAPLRTTVAVKLLQASRKIYDQAGVASFKEYSSAAEQAGIVTLGGSLGYTWISLNSRFHDLAGAPSVPPS